MVPLQIVLASVLGWSGNLDGVVLDFSATWCGPCQEMSPLVSRLERQGYPIRKVDVDANPELTRRFNVQRMPTFIVVIDGQEQARVLGKCSEDQLKRLCARIPKREAAAATTEQPVGSRQADERAPGKPLSGEAPAPRKGGFRLPFIGNKQEPTQRDAREGAIPRGNIDDRMAASPPAAGTPLGASVRIRIRDGQGENVGSGTIIDSRVGRTIVLTCGHIFRHWDKQAVIEVDYFSEGREQTVIAKRIDHDLEDDVGLIGINVDPLPSCRVAPPGTKILKGAPVVSVGCSNGENPTLQSLRVTALNRYLGADNIECSGVPAQGRSGGGLFTQEGQLIGVCTAAAPHNREGLYAGLRTVQKLLDRCELAELYRPAGARKASVGGPNELEIAVNDPSTGDAADARARDRQTVPTTKTAPGAGGAVETADEERAVRDALEQSGEAEVVCIIRPVNQPRAASRVVILNRASKRFVEYLSDEIQVQDDIRPTTLTESRPSPKKPIATQNAKRLTTSGETESAAPTQPAPKRYSGPQAYRRSPRVAAAEGR